MGRVAWQLGLAGLSVAAAVALLAPATAGAERGITVGIAAPEYGSLDGSLRDVWFSRTVEGNADLVRIDVVWRRVVGSQRPANPRDPADPAYDFSGLDAAVREANQRGLKVLFTVFGAPDWATGPNRPNGAEPGAWRPDPGDFADFGTALATRYSGGFFPGGGGSLPRVRHFEAWNEPNLDQFLAPQSVGRRAEGAVIYRSLLNSFYDAVKDVDPGSTVLSGGTAPFGDPPGGRRTRPVRFLRELFCLRGRKRLQPRRCPKVKMDALAHHAIAGANPPTYSAIHPDDAVMSDINRLKRVLRAAQKARVVRPGGKRPIWATELWWRTSSTNPAIEVPFVSERKQARYIEQGLYVLWKQRVGVAIQFLLRDPGGISLFQTGLFSVDGNPKPAYRAFRFPFVAERVSRERVRAWGRSPEAGKVKVERRKRGRWRTVKRFRVREDEVFTARVSRSKRMRARIGSTKSLVW